MAFTVADSAGDLAGCLASFTVKVALSAALDAVRVYTVAVRADNGAAASAEGASDHLVAVAGKALRVAQAFAGVAFIAVHSGAFAPFADFIHAQQHKGAQYCRKAHSGCSQESFHSIYLFFVLLFTCVYLPIKSPSFHCP
jgi:hypothetical protein